MLPYLSRNGKSVMADAIPEVPITQFLFKIATRSPWLHYFDEAIVSCIINISVVMARNLELPISGYVSQCVVVITWSWGPR